MKSQLLLKNVILNLINVYLFHCHICYFIFEVREIFIFTITQSSVILTCCVDDFLFNRSNYLILFLFYNYTVQLKSVRASSETYSFSCSIITLISCLITIIVSQFITIPNIHFFLKCKFTLTHYRKNVYD